MRSLPLYLALVLLAASAGLAAPVEKTEVAPNPNLIQPLLIGSQVPSVKLLNGNGETVDLAAEVAKKPTVIVFYRGGWCPLCMKQLKKLSEEWKNMDVGDYQLFAISQDDPKGASQTQKKQGLGFPTLSDNDMTAANAFGITFRVDETTLTKYKEYNIDLVGLYGRQEPLLAVPAVFVFGTDGALDFNYVNPDYRVRLDPAILSAILKAYHP